MKCIKLSRGLYAKVDDRHFQKLNKFKWSVREDMNGNLYTLANIKGVNTSMHQLLMGKRLGFVIDHIDRDGLNNQKKNLRFVSISQNGFNCKGRSRNKTGCIGVYIQRDKRGNEYYIATITHNGIRIRLGCHKVFGDAVAVRKKAEKKFFKGILKYPQINKRHSTTPDNPILKRFYGGVSGIRGVYAKGKNKWIGRFRKNGRYYYTSAGYNKNEVFEDYKILFKKHFGFDTPFIPKLKS